MCVLPAIIEQFRPDLLDLLHTPMSKSKVPLDNAPSSSSAMFRPRSRLEPYVELPSYGRSKHRHDNPTDSPARASTSSRPLEVALHVNIPFTQPHNHLHVVAQAPAVSIWKQGQLTLQEARSEGQKRLREIKCQWSEDGDQCDAVLASYSLFMRVS